MPISLRGSGPKPNTWFLGRTRVHIPINTLIGLAVFVGLTVVTDRQTNTPTTLHIRSNKPTQLSLALRCGLEKLRVQY